jgi:alcohol dehydrogenase class IV
MDYLEVVGRGLPLQNPSAPFVAMPTTSGTGAEVTRNAVLSVPEKQFKVSLRSPHLLPRLALVDPELTLSAPRYVKACSGLDALTQLLEPWVGIRGNWVTDAFCREGLMKFSQAFPTVLEDPENVEAHEMMALASLLSGLALANSGLGVIHGFAAPLGGMYSAPHGAICARLAAPGVKANIDFLEAMKSSSDASGTIAVGVGGDGRDPLMRYQQAAQMLLNDHSANVEDLLLWLDQLVEKSQIPRLKDFGVQREDFSFIADKAMQSGSMKGNPIVLPKNNLIQILEAAF